MTITAAANRLSYAGNNTTTVFPTPKFLANADLVVLLVNDATGVGVTQTLTTNYTLAGAGADPGGTCTMLVAPASGETLLIYSDPALTQPVDLVDNGPMPAQTYENALDRLTLIARRVRELVVRALAQPDEDVDAIDTLPNATGRAGKYLAFDGDGNPVATAGTGDPTVISAFMATVVDDTSAANARTTLGAYGSGSAASLASLTVAAASISVDGKTVTAPAASGTIATVAGAETLTNKTLTSPVLNTGVSGTAVASTAEQSIGTDATKIVVTGRQKNHPSAAKAWVNFNGTGTPAIRSSYNVTSITYNGTGDYTINFTDAMPNANYAVAGSSTGLLLDDGGAAGAAKTTTACRVSTYSIAGARTDYANVSVAIFSN